MKEPKFKEFFCITDNKIHTLDDLRNISDLDYYLKYNGKMLCPLCKKAKLSRSHRGKKAFIKANPGQKHGDVDGNPCIYRGETKKSEIIGEEIRELNNQVDIDNYLRAALNVSRGIDKIGAKKGEEKNKEEKGNIIDDSSGKRVHRKVLKCSWEKWNKDLLLDTYYIVHGVVNVKVIIDERDGNDGEKIMNRYLRLYSCKNGRLITSIWANDCAKEVTDGKYDVVVYAKLSIFRGYANCYLWSNKSIRCRKVD